ncbi:MAG: succinate dehydrogenase flavoprotein subunit [Chloroflexi bacterium]|nr:succinate dehydrogenase flavoprotein subunit [Chloroflexota bacterium]
MTVHKFDAVIIGAGGAGLWAALELSKHPDLKVAVLSKLYPVRSHTGTAQGGIGAALANLEEDHWEWHMFDTVKGGDYLVDQDAAEVLCREAIETVYELEHMGLPFSRTPEGKIDQRRFGGHTKNYGEAPVRRSCYAADRTGHMILQTLYQQCIKNNVNFFDEYHFLDLILVEGRTAGVVALEIKSGELNVFQAKTVLLATGGFGKIYKITSNAHSLTGDGVSIAFRRGIPLEDMEFFQFHPTGIYKLGILLTEAMRGEGGKLLNGEGERFMERYAPTLLDLAPRDLISRAMYLEIREGRGVGGNDYLHLDVRHLGKNVILAKLPDMLDFVRTYVGVDMTQEMVPVQPTAHYAMGGIPTDIEGRVVTDEKNTPLPGLYAAGECACVSVHGGNRLGTNSLVDILVFGRRSGRDMAKFVKDNELPELPKEPEGATRAEVSRLLNSRGPETVGKLREELQQTMQDYAGVFREEDGLASALSALGELKQRYRRVSLQDRGKKFNTDLLEAMELGYLLDIAEATVYSAQNRTESRGAHWREDFPKRDDANWLKHTLLYRKDGGLEVKYKPVTITKFQPQERKY